MSLEMSLPHGPRLQTVGGDGSEAAVAPGADVQWELYFTVQQALAQARARAQREAEAAGDEGDTAAAGGEAEQGKDGKAAAAAPQVADPAKALELLMTARGELDVITDLVTFVEQQQFLSVEGIHRPPPSLEERLRARALRLAAARTQLAGAGGLLKRGLAALQAQAAVDDRFLADLTQLRRRWKLRRHSGGAAGLFFVDLSLPLRGAAARCLSQDGAQCNLLQDTNGDACLVEAAAPAGGRRRAVRGWAAIHAVLQHKQQLLVWRLLAQLLEAGARQEQHERDVDGAVAAVQRMAAAAAAAAQAALYRAVAGNSGGGGSGGAADMEVDGEQQEAAAAAPAAAAASSLGATAGSAAHDIRAVLSEPGLQQQFEARALLLLAGLLPGGSSSSSTGGGAAAGSGEVAGAGVLESALRWLRHAALRRRVAASLHRWAAQSGSRAVLPVDTGEEFTAAWQLSGGSSSGGGGSAPALVIVSDGRLRAEGAAAAAGILPQALQRGLNKAELECLLSAL